MAEIRNAKSNAYVQADFGQQKFSVFCSKFAMNALPAPVAASTARATLINRAAAR
ncbi:hypothetical protein [Bradyrhizobium sp. USDA 10063]